MSGYVRLCPVLSLEPGEDAPQYTPHMRLIRSNPAIRALLVLGITLLGFVLGAILLPPMGSDSNADAVGRSPGSSGQSK